MMVKNDFPSVDLVLRKLREYVAYFNRKKEEAPPEEKDKYDMYLNFASEFTSAIANYLDSVCNAHIRIARAKEECESREDLQNIIEREDSKRTRYHSKIISTMIMIDRIATRNGLQKVFDFAGEFENDYSRLTPSTIQEKARMSPEARRKRREMGNFGLYIGASITAGMSREYMITDDEARNFANCEGQNQQTDSTTFEKIRITAPKAKRNIEDVIDIS